MIDIAKDNAPIEVEETKRLPRRKFLKFVGLCGLGVAALTSPVARSAIEWFSRNDTQQSTQPSIDKKPQSSSSFGPDLVFRGETYQYDKEIQDIIDGVKKDFDVNILTPKTWGEKNDLNLPWDLKSVSLVAEALSQLPSEYHKSNRSPREILLLRSSGSSSEGAGGGYNGRSVILMTSENFSPEQPFRGDEAAKLYGLQGDHLRASVAHEYTHSFTEANPKLFTDWVDQMKWIQQEDGKWVNQDVDTVINDGGAAISPLEDMAVSAGLMLVNHFALSPNRIFFFHDNKLWFV